MSGWLIAIIAVVGLSVLILLLLTAGVASVRITLREEIRVSARILGIRFRLYSPKGGADGPGGYCRNPERALKRELKRQRKAERRAAKKRQKQRERAAETANLPKPNLRENLSMVRALTEDVYRTTQGKIRIRALRMHIVVATDNAAKTALLWAGISGSASLLLNWIDTHFAKIERYEGDVSIRPDFGDGEPAADIDLVFSTHIIQALHVALTLRSRYREEKSKAQLKAIRRVKRKAAGGK